MTGRITLAELRKGFNMARALSDPESFLELHRERQGAAVREKAA